MKITEYCDRPRCITPAEIELTTPNGRLKLCAKDGRPLAEWARKHGLKPKGETR